MDYDLKKNDLKPLRWFALGWVIVFFLILVYGDEQLALMLHNPDTTSPFSQFVVFVTKTLVYLVLGFLAVLLSLTFVFTPLKQHRRLLLGALLSTTISFLITGMIKSSINRIRPIEFFTSGEIVDYGVDYHDSSMPSGHASNSAALVIPVAMKLRNKFAIGFLIFFHAFMCYTRIYIGVHWVSDTLVGSILGVIISFIVIIGLDWLYENREMTPRLEFALSAFSILIIILMGIFF